MNTSYDELKDLIYFKGGKPYNKLDRNYNAKKDQVAGKLNQKGYRQLSVRVGGIKTQVAAHRLLWYIVYNYLPIELDHINHNRDDNQINNLREVSRSENIYHSRKRKQTSSKYRGVSWSKTSNKWVAYITIDKSNIHLGYFEKETLAANAYNRSVIENGLSEFIELNVT